MTLLDAGVLLCLVLLAAGGYEQGLLRGLLRLLALLAIAVLGALLALGLSPGGPVDAVLLRAVLLFGGVTVIIATAAWLLNQLVPLAAHRSPLNRALGVIPALVVGLLGLALVLGLAHRVAFGDELQRYLGDGLVTGPLTRPLRWLESVVVVLPR